MDNEPKHLIAFKAGRVMKFEDYGDDKYKFPKVYLYPQKLINYILLSQVQQVQNVAIENYQKKKERCI